MNAKDICFLEEKEILTVDRKHLLYSINVKVKEAYSKLTVDRKHLLYSINLKVMLTEELKRYKKKLVEL